MIKRLKGWWACKHGRHDWVEDKATLVAEELMQGDSVYRLTMGGGPRCARAARSVGVGRTGSRSTRRSTLSTGPPDEQDLSEADFVK